jgi:hypothetical protein
MNPEELQNMVAPVKTNGEIQTLKDERHGVKNFCCSWYSREDKVLLKGESSWEGETKLVMCVQLGKEPVKGKETKYSVFCLPFFRLKLFQHFVCVRIFHI